MKLSKKGLAAAGSIGIVVIIGSGAYIYDSHGSKKNKEAGRNNSSGTSSIQNPNSIYDNAVKQKAPTFKPGDKKVLGTTQRQTTPPQTSSPGAGPNETQRIKGIITEPQAGHYKLLNPQAREQSLDLDFSKSKNNPKPFVNSSIVTVTGKFSRVSTGDNYTLVLVVDSIQK